MLLTSSKSAMTFSNFFFNNSCIKNQRLEYIYIYILGENCSLIHKKVVFKPIIVIFNGLNSPYQANIKQTFEILRKGFYLTYTRFKPMIENNQYSPWKRRENSIKLLRKSLTLYVSNNFLNKFQRNIISFRFHTLRKFESRNNTWQIAANSFHPFEKFLFCTN